MYMQGERFEIPSTKRCHRESQHSECSYMLVVVVQFGIIVPTVIFRTNWRKEIKSSAKSGNKLHDQWRFDSLTSFLRDKLGHRKAKSIDDSSFCDSNQSDTFNKQQTSGPMYITKSHVESQYV
uniref:Uncharacterized protein n=1 Tax=Glossina pallidipes TaxID=7398 RepID=A0A1A9Z368_GLOPL